MSPAASTITALTLIRRDLWDVLPFSVQSAEFDGDFFNLVAYVQTANFEPLETSDTFEEVSMATVPLFVTEFVYRYPYPDKKRLFVADWNYDGTVSFTKWMVNLRPDFKFRKTAISWKQAYSEGSGFPLRFVWERLGNEDKQLFDHDLAKFLGAAGVSASNISRLYPCDVLISNGLTA